jgi:hypothetical protein
MRIMRTDLPGRARAGILAIATLAVTAGLLAGTPSGAAASGDANIVIRGGDALSQIVCGNVAAAQTLANQRHIVLQRSHCAAAATGGSVTLENVDIYVSRSAAARNRGNPVLAALTGGVPTHGTMTADAANCTDGRPPPPGNVQVNNCWAVAHGGRLVMRNVHSVNRSSDGRTTVRSVAALTLPIRAVSDGDGGASAYCHNIVTDPLSQRDDCAGVGGAAGWSLRGVDVVLHNPDGSTSTRHGINIDISGGQATANIYCFNVTDGSGRVVQINVCSANAQGGDATLHNVTIHSES